MTTVLTIAQRKGGAGKTTLACQLAVALVKRGHRLHAIDTDEQASFTHWAGHRQRRYGKLDFEMDAGTGFGLPSIVRRARARADIILIDTPPTADRAVARAIGLADLVLSPMQLSPLDLEASIPTAELIGSLRKPALFIVNRAPPRARIADRIRAKINECKLPVAQQELGNRAAFAESLATGRGVLETDPHGAASTEIDMLCDEILSRAGLSIRAA